MRRIVSMVVAATSAIVVGAQGPSARDADVQFQLGNLLYEEARYRDALDAYRQAIDADHSGLSLRARIGFVRTALRLGEFEQAQEAAVALHAQHAGSAEAISMSGDAHWAAGLFDEAEARWREALAIEPALSRARHGLAKALASRGRLDEAMVEAQAALKAAPRDEEMHHTVGAIFERMHRYEQAAAAYTNFVNLLPNKDRSDKAAWSRAQIRFLRSFGERQPNHIPDDQADRLHTVDFKVVDDKVVIQARVNGGRPQDFVVDTGSELTTISRPTASARGVRPITYTLTAGVGEVGLRGLQLGRLDTLEIGTLKMSNVPVLIKAPALRNIPKREAESLSPLALGLSLTVDYTSNRLTIGRRLPEEPAKYRLPMRHHRLSMVRGLLNDTHPAYFVVDTGGEVISISTATAEALAKEPPRRIALKVYGTSGWDRDAFLLPGIDLRFDEIAYSNFSLVVLNLRAPSVLLGFQLGGIVGHKFLSPYRVSLDLERSELRMAN
ncbi:MAG: aspartyl protease family protein [Acidobacteriota bacterium]